jgi:hypothetical protein
MSNNNPYVSGIFNSKSCLDHLPHYLGLKWNIPLQLNNPIQSSASNASASNASASNPSTKPIKQIYFSDNVCLIGC